jgi:hypothetical protein
MTNFQIKPKPKYNVKAGSLVVTAEQLEWIKTYCDELNVSRNEFFRGLLEAYHAYREETK